MNNFNKVIAVVPARSGSKGLHNKNFKPFAGKSLLYYAVHQGIEIASQCIITSDRTDLCDLFELNDSPLVRVVHRSQSLAGDSVAMETVLLDLTSKAVDKDATIILLQPTSPLRTIDQLHQALDFFNSYDTDIVMSVSKAEKSLLKGGFVQGSRFVPVNNPKFPFTNRQELPDFYLPNGAIYIFNAGWFLDNGGFFGGRITAIEMCGFTSIDIDDLESFNAAETLFARSRLFS